VAQKAAPFRWNVSNPRLGRRLGRGPSLRVSRSFKEELVRCAARVVRAAGDVDLVFVGRSAENLYDLLGGLLEETTWRERPALFQLSLRRDTPGRLRRERPGALARLWSHADELGLTPEGLVARPRPVAFVDTVFRGRTFGNLLKLLRHWVGGRPALWPAVRERLRWVAIVERGHPRYAPWDPGGCRWTRPFAPERLQRVFVDWRTWRYLAEDQPKTTPSHPPAAWGSARARRPPTEPERLQAARLARALFRHGRWQRRHFAAELERGPAPEPWLTDLIGQLRGRPPGP